MALKMGGRVSVGNLTVLALARRISPALNGALTVHDGTDDRVDLALSRRIIAGEAL